MGSRSIAVPVTSPEKEELGLHEAAAELELRPGGMVVQKRDADGDGTSAPSGPDLLVTVWHADADRYFSLPVPPPSTFGYVKRALAQNFGVEPQTLKLLFRGREKDDGELLQAAGVKDGSKLVVHHDPVSVAATATAAAAAEERVQQEQGEMDEGMRRALEAVARVRAEVDKLAAKAGETESAVHSGKKVEEKEFIVLTELLMVQLLKLDAIQADGAAREQRRAEVRRVQNLVDTVDRVKATNAQPFSDRSKTVSVTTNWETFNSGFGSLSAPPPRVLPPTEDTTDWEQFD